VTDLPPYLTPAELAPLCSWTRRRTESMLRRAGILERLGGHWVVSSRRLSERLPEIYDRAFQHFVLGARSRHKSP
jgi:hypothetical protein